MRHFDVIWRVGVVDLGHLAPSSGSLFVLSRLGVWPGESWGCDACVEIVG